MPNIVTRPAAAERSIRFFAAAVSLAALSSGCAPSEVYQVSTRDNGGVPFFPLVAVNKETRVYEQRWLRVEVTVKTLVPVPAKPKAETSSAVVFFAGGAKPEEAVKVLAKELLDAGNDDVKVRAALAKLTLPGDWSLAEPACLVATDPAKLRALTVIGVQRGIDQVPAISMSYINVLAPHGGSATAEVHLDPRGVLTQANGGVQDQLPPALVTAMSTLGGAALGAAGTVGAAALLQDNGPDHAPPLTLPGDKAIVTAVTIGTTTGRRTYTLTTLWPLHEPVPPKDPQGPASPTFFDLSPNPCAEVTAPATTPEKHCVVSVSSDTPQYVMPNAKPSK